MVEHREHLGGHVGWGDFGEVLPATGDQGTERVVTAGSCYDAGREQGQPAFQRAQSRHVLAGEAVVDRGGGPQETAAAAAGDRAAPADDGVAEVAHDGDDGAVGGLPSVEDYPLQDGTRSAVVAVERLAPGRTVEDGAGHGAHRHTMGASAACRAMAGPSQMPVQYVVSSAMPSSPPRRRWTSRHIRSWSPWPERSSTTTATADAARVTRLEVTRGSLIPASPAVIASKTVSGPWSWNRQWGVLASRTRSARHRARSPLRSWRRSASAARSRTLSASYIGPSEGASPRAITSSAPARAPCWRCTSPGGGPQWMMSPAASTRSSARRARPAPVASQRSQTWWPSATIATPQVPWPWIVVGTPGANQRTASAGPPGRWAITTERPELMLARRAVARSRAAAPRARRSPICPSTPAAMSGPASAAVIWSRSASAPSTRTRSRVGALMLAPPRGRSW